MHAALNGDPRGAVGGLLACRSRSACKVGEFTGRALGLCWLIRKLRHELTRSHRGQRRLPTKVLTPQRNGTVVSKITCDAHRGGAP